MAPVGPHRHYTHTNPTWIYIRLESVKQFKQHQNWNTKHQKVAKKKQQQQQINRRIDEGNVSNTLST